MARTARRIVTEVHDEPHLRGRRVTVPRIRGLVEGADESADEVAQRFDLEVADVYAALQYHTHPEEMEEATRKRRAREEDAREAGGKSLVELQRERDEKADDVSNSG